MDIGALLLSKKNNFWVRIIFGWGNEVFYLFMKYFLGEMVFKIGQVGK